MGRLFQYNRFSNKSTAVAVGEPRERKMVRKNLKKCSIMNADKSNKYQKLICPAYADLYPDDCENATESNSTTCSRFNSHMQTSPLIMAMAAKGMSFPTVKSVEVAVKKYGQWSSKLLANVSENSEIEDCSQLSSSSPTSGFHSYRTSSDDEILTTTSTTTSSAKKCKLYECMKDFLRRKLFHQQQQQQQQYIIRDSSVVVGEDVEDEPTSDYYEADDLLQSTSYCADGDDEDDDETCCCIDADSTDDEECLLTLTNDTISLTTSNRLASETTVSSGSGSFNCFPYTAHVAADDTDFWDDSDAGISDCCQLLSDRSPKQNQQRTHSVEQIEVIEAPWFLPNIPAKSAIAQLAKENPGTFVVRQCGKDGSYSLYLRLESKVKKFAIIRSARYYKLKGAKKEFSSLKALVTHHSLMAEQLPLTLILPRPAELKSKSRRYPDDFDTFESLQLLGIFELLQSEGAE